MTVEISDWSLDARMGERGEMGEGNSKREITANRMRRGRRSLAKVCVLRRSRLYFRIFLCIRRRS